jgi:hypothetical protein
MRAYSLLPRYQEKDEQKERQNELDLQGIEPWTTPMLREYYTTKPQARRS